MLDGPQLNTEGHLMFTLTLPLRIAVSAKKDFTLNLNYYRNADPFLLGKAKDNYALALAKQVKALPKFKTVQLTYTLFPQTKRLQDVSNPCSIIDKFFSDCLTEHGIIEDDNYLYLTQTTYRFGAVDKLNPRCEVIVTGELQE